MLGRCGGATGLPARPPDVTNACQIDPDSNDHRDADRRGGRYADAGQHLCSDSGPPGSPPKSSGPPRSRVSRLACRSVGHSACRWSCASHRARESGALGSPPGSCGPARLRASCPGRRVVTSPLGGRVPGLSAPPSDRALRATPACSTPPRYGVPRHLGRCGPNRVGSCRHVRQDSPQTRFPVQPCPQFSQRQAGSPT